MTYTELIDRLSEKTGNSKKDTRDQLESVLNELTDHLSKGDGFTIPDLGTFKTETKEVRKIYNPHHEAYMLIPPKRSVDFTQSATLKEKLKFIQPDNE